MGKGSMAAHSLSMKLSRGKTVGEAVAVVDAVASAAIAATKPDYPELLDSTGRKRLSLRRETLSAWIVFGCARSCVRLIQLNSPGFFRSPYSRVSVSGWS